MTLSNLERVKEFQAKGISLDPFFNLTADLLCIAGFDGYFRKVNPAFKKLMGYSPEELYSRPINEFIHEEDKELTDSQREQLRSNKPLLNFENRYIRKSGEVVWLSWTSMPIPEEGLVYAIAKNITHIKKMEEERNLLLARLSRVNQNLKMLTYSTSHDLRSPVANLEMVFNLLDISKIDDEETREILDAMNKTTQSLKETLNNYLDVLGHEDKDETDLEELFLMDIFRKVTSSIDSLVAGSKTTFEVDFSAFDTVCFSRIFMESAFLNLITNSIKYSRPDVFPVISIKSRWKDGKKQLVFSDNGRGFDTARVKDRMFGLRQRFTDQKDSQGIGLYLVNNNIQSMGGKLEVESEVNKGASFIITFKEESA